MDEMLKYDRVTEPRKAQKAQIWKTAIGLQAVDGLKTSEYLIDVARQHIEGDITIDEAGEYLREYYKARHAREESGEREEEADLVSQRITKILSEGGFSFTPSFYCNIHRKLFEGIYKFAGQIRDFNITKKEWVLSGDTVIYGNAPDISATLDYDFGVERSFSYKGLDKSGIVQHISHFVAYLWQIHAFGEGNTRTTAVFTILYLRSLGFEVDNDLFENNSWYFRNALVRANYNNLKKGIAADQSYLEAFFDNLLYGGNNILSNRSMHDSHPLEKKAPESSRKQAIVDFVAANPGSSAVIISRELGIPLRTIQRELAGLSDRIEHKGSSKTGGYYLREV